MIENTHFVFELGCDELPSSSLLQLKTDLQNLIEKQLELAEISFETISMIASPRRLGFEITGLPLNSPDQKFERRGPAVDVAYLNGAPTKALIGFCKGLNISTDDVSTIQTDKGNWITYTSTKPGAPTENIIGQLCVNAVKALPLSNSMRWGEAKDEFPRPVRWILAIFNTTVVDIHLFSKRSSRSTFGHRFHSPEKIEITNATNYTGDLLSRCVITNFEIRKIKIWSEIQNIASQCKVEVSEDDLLLNEIASLVEWPVVYFGKFNKEFLSIPSVVLIAAMRGHQKYFHTVTKDKELSNIFIAVSNIASIDPNKVKSGNQRVIHARLSDAKFFLENDRKTTLEARRPRLNSIMFHPELGSLGDKTSRVKNLVLKSASELGLNRELASSAVELSRCDLVTEMVLEFDELQGEIGSIYAAYENLDPVVVNAIRGLYMPRGGSGEIPNNLLGAFLGLCDRIDTLCGLFAVKQPPSGSKDPFGLRRAAIGILKLNDYSGLRLDLLPLIKHSLGLQPVENDEDVLNAVIQFIRNRQKVRLIESALPHDIVVAAQSRVTLVTFQTKQKAKSLQKFKSHPEFYRLVAANKRIVNILTKSNRASFKTVDPSMFVGDAERELSHAVSTLKPEIYKLVSRETYGEALDLLAQTPPLIDRFFDAVIVHDPKPTIEANRLALLNSIRELFLTVADLNEIQI